MTGLECTCHPETVQLGRAERRKASKKYGRPAAQMIVHREGCPLAPKGYGRHGSPSKNDTLR